VSDGRLSFSKCPSLALSLDAASGSTVAATSGPSVVVLDQSVGSGAYTYVVSGDGTGQCSFTLTVTDPL
jgi:hypothetical protein